MTRVYNVPLNAKTVPELLPVIRRLLEELQAQAQQIENLEKQVNELKSKP